MMGKRRVEQGSLIYEFCLDRHAPEGHLLRAIDRFVDLDGVRGSNGGEHLPHSPKYPPVAAKARGRTAAATRL
jgi:hypothetical protein